MHANQRTASRGTPFAASFVVLASGIAVGATIILIAYQYALLGLALVGGTVLLAAGGLALWLTGRENRERFAKLLGGRQDHQKARAEAQAEARRLAEDTPPDWAFQAATPVEPEPPRRPSFGEVHHPRAKAARAAAASEPAQGQWPVGGKPYPAGFEEPAAPQGLVEFQRADYQNRPAGVSVSDGHVEPAAALVTAPPSPPAPRGAPGRSGPAAGPRPPMAWPGQKDADTWKTFRQDSPRRYERQDLSVEHQRRRKEMTGKLPTVGGVLENANRPGKGAVPEGKSRGKCSGCSTILYAPKKRPITVVCPQCGHKARLK